MGDSADWVEAAPRAFVLQSPPDVFATLELEGATRAVAAATEGRWSIDWKQGLANVRGLVRELDSRAEVAACESRLPTRASVSFGGGGQFSLVPASFLLTQWTWKSSDGREILTLDRGVSGARVQLLLASDRFRELSLLACLGWYLLLQWWTPRSRRRGE